MKSYAQIIADEITAEAVEKFSRRIVAKLCEMRPTIKTDAAIDYTRGINAAIEAIIEEKQAVQEELGG